MRGSEESCFSLEEEDLSVVAHPEFIDRFDGDEGTAEGVEAIIKALDSAEVKEIAGADQVTAADPALHFFNREGRQHDR